VLHDGRADLRVEAVRPSSDTSSQPDENAS